MAASVARNVLRGVLTWKLIWLSEPAKNSFDSVKTVKRIFHIKFETIFLLIYALGYC